MKPFFKYSILKYVHSQVLGEELNIGIALLFPSFNKLVFYPSKNLGKLKAIYASFSEKKIKLFLDAFEEKAAQLSNSALNEDLDGILNKFFLVKESAPLQFSKSSVAVLYQDDWKQISEHFFRMYFPEGTTTKARSTTSRKLITATYKNLLFENDKNILKYFAPPVEIKNTHVHFRSDLAWQNHTVNAVKGLSLDLATEELISDRALLYNAKLNYLEREAKDKGIRFDLLVSAPQNPDLRKAYHQALDILQDIKAPKEIIQEEHLADYAKRTLRELVR